MTFDIDFFVATAVSEGRFTAADMGKVNPCSNIAIDYAASVLKAARRERVANVVGLTIEVDDLDDFQYFYIDGTEVTASAWNNELLRLLESRFKKAFELEPLICGCGQPAEPVDMIDDQKALCRRCFEVLEDAAQAGLEAAMADHRQ